MDVCGNDGRQSLHRHKRLVFNRTVLFVDWKNVNIPLIFIPNKIEEKKFFCFRTNKESCRMFWYSALISLIIVFISVSVALTIYLYTFFVPHRNCKMNSMFISIASGSCFVFFIFAIFVASKNSKIISDLNWFKIQVWANFVW